MDTFDAPKPLHASTIPAAVDEGGCQLAALEAEVRACRLCAEAFATTRTAHEPRPILQPSTSARLCLAGQAPGLRAYRSGKPFDDPSGVRLRSWMGVDETTFWDSERVAILPMGFCFPGHDANGGDLPPPRRCAETWRRRLFDAHPRFDLVLLIGAYAQGWHLPSDRGKGRPSLTERVRRWRGALEGSDVPRILPLPHPSWRNNAWLKRNPWFEAETVPALRQAVAVLL